MAPKVLSKVQGLMQNMTMNNTMVKIINADDRVKIDEHIHFREVKNRRLAFVKRMATRKEIPPLIKSGQDPLRMLLSSIVRFLLCKGPVV